MPKVSELPVATVLNDEDTLLVIQDGVTKQCDKSLVGGGGGDDNLDILNWYEFDIFDDNGVYTSLSIEIPMDLDNSGADVDNDMVTINVEGSYVKISNYGTAGDAIGCMLNFQVHNNSIVNNTSLSPETEQPILNNPDMHTIRIIIDFYSYGESPDMVPYINGKIRLSAGGNYGCDFFNTTVTLIDNQAH